jgi:hypothetical protein
LGKWCTGRFDSFTPNNSSLLLEAVGVATPAVSFFVCYLLYRYTDTNIAELDENTLMKYWDENIGVWEDAACGPYERHLDGNWPAVPICHWCCAITDLRSPAKH